MIRFSAPPPKPSLRVASRCASVQPSTFDRPPTPARQPGASRQGQQRTAVSHACGPEPALRALWALRGQHHAVRYPTWLLPHTAYSKESRRTAQADVHAILGVQVARQRRVKAAVDPSQRAVAAGRAEGVWSGDEWRQRGRLAGCDQPAPPHATAASQAGTAERRRPRALTPRGSAARRPPASAGPSGRPPPRLRRWGSRPGDSGGRRQAGGGGGSGRGQTATLGWHRQSALYLTSPTSPTSGPA